MRRVGKGHIASSLFACGIGFLAFPPERPPGTDGVKVEPDPAFAVVDIRRAP